MSKKPTWLAWQLHLSAMVLAVLMNGGCSRDLVFSTYTTIGVELKAPAGQAIPTSVRFGYKRFEGALIPVNPEKEGPANSVLATIAAKQTLFDVRISQVFATGKAAIIAAETERAAGMVGKLGPMARAIEAVQYDGTGGTP